MPRPLSRSIQPCLPRPATEPPTGQGWLHEIKHDGFRILARRDANGVRLFTRNGYNFADRFPRIVEAVANLPVQSCFIDGEAIVVDESGLSVFELIRYRHHNDAAVLCAFDLIELDGKDLRLSPIEDRKRTLAELLRKKSDGIVSMPITKATAQTSTNTLARWAVRASCRSGWDRLIHLAVELIGSDQVPNGAGGEARSGRRLGAPMSDDDKIYVDAEQPATLNNGAGKLTDYRTLREAVMAWHLLPPEQTKRATIKVIGGPVYTAAEIVRLHYGPRPGVSKMAWFVHYWDETNNRNIRSSEISAREDAMRKACSLMREGYVVSHVAGPNGERVDIVDIRAWCSAHASN